MKTSAQERSQQARLQGELVNTQKLANQQASDLRMQQQMLRSQVQQLDAQIAIEQKQVASMSALLTKIRPLLQSGYVSAMQIQQQETQELDAEGQVKSLLRERYEAQQQLATASDQYAQVPLSTEAKLSELRGQIVQAEQSLNSTEADRETVLRASSTGLVSSIMVKQGQNVSGGQALLAIVPKDSPLEAQLLVPSSAIGFVQVGTPVTLHYQAFPYQKFGVQHGSVMAVSRSALTPSEVTTLLGDEPPKQAMYRVDVRLERQAITAYGTVQSLRPGMVLDANLLLDKRRLLEWIFEPLFGMGRRFRERTRER